MSLIGSIEEASKSNCDCGDPPSPVWSINSSAGWIYAGISKRLAKSPASRVWSKCPWVSTMASMAKPCSVLNSIMRPIVCIPGSTTNARALCSTTYVFVLYGPAPKPRICMMTTISRCCALTIIRKFGYPAKCEIAGMGSQFLLQSSQSLVVVWLVSDLVYELRVHDLVVSIGNDDTACQQAREWGILQGCAEVLTEGRTES